MLSGHSLKKSATRSISRKKCRHQKSKSTRRIASEDVFGHLSLKSDFKGELDLVSCEECAQETGGGGKRDDIIDFDLIDKD
jgi:hypothetical protein